MVCGPLPGPRLLREAGFVEIPLGVLGWEVVMDAVILPLELRPMPFDGVGREAVLVHVLAVLVNDDPVNVAEIPQGPVCWVSVRYHKATGLDVGHDEIKPRIGGVCR